MTDDLKTPECVCGHNRFVLDREWELLQHPEWEPGHHMTEVSSRPIYRCSKCTRPYGEPDPFAGEEEAKDPEAKEPPPDKSAKDPKGKK